MRKKEQEQIAASKPKFLSKKQRETEAREQREAAAKLKIERFVTACYAFLSY
jgi:hypothetical protein